MELKITSQDSLSELKAARKLLDELITNKGGSYTESSTSTPDAPVGAFGMFGNDTSATPSTTTSTVLPTTQIPEAKEEPKDNFNLQPY